MKKILILIIVILLVGVISGIVTISISSTDFKTKITTISSELFYTKLLTDNKIDSKEIPKDTTLDIEGSGLEITQNKDGVYRVRAI